MKFLFLDVDGVMTTRRSMSPTSSAFDPEAVAQLNRILKTIPDLKLVISSTWRLFHSTDELKSIFSAQGVTSGHIFGKTPDLKGKERGDEIAMWIGMAELWSEEEGDQFQFAIVDDDNDMGALKDHLFRTKFDDGLNENIANSIIKHFGK